MNEVDEDRDQNRRGTDDCGDEVENLEAHPVPGGVAVAAPNGRDCGVATQDYLEEDKLQARAEIEEDEPDDKANCKKNDSHRDDSCNESRRSGGQMMAWGAIGAVTASHLRKEGDGTDLERETPVSGCDENAGGMIPGGADGVGSGERAHAAPRCEWRCRKRIAVCRDSQDLFCEPRIPGGEGAFALNAVALFLVADLFAEIFFEWE